MEETPWSTILPKVLPQNFTEDQSFNTWAFGGHSISEQWNSGGVWIKYPDMFRENCNLNHIDYDMKMESLSIYLYIL